MTFIDDIRTDKLPNIDIWINEAKFGFSYIKKHLEALPNGTNVLEVGCGSGILMGLVKEHFPKLNLDGLEPFGSGFTELEDFQSNSMIQKLNILTNGYETYDTETKYDLIYLVNVFEHLPDWQDFISFIDRHLTESGKCIILCPNYHFPYESHFRLPIIFTKNLTQKIFRKKIDAFEVNNNVHGLWDSLNFVKLRQVQVATRKASMNLKVKTSVVRDMVERLDTDTEFAKRQKTISALAKVINNLGLLSIFDIPFFQKYIPYMMLEMSK